MKLGGLSGGLFTFCIWFSRLALLNLLWFFFTMLGLVIFGIFPATVAMLETLKKCMEKQEPFILKTFWKSFKREFFKSNILAVIFMAVLSLCYLHFTLSSALGGSLGTLFVIISYLFISMVLLITCHVLSSYVEYELSVKHHIKNGILLFISSPLANLVLVFGSVTVYLIHSFIPGSAFFFSASLLGLVIISSNHLSFKKVKKHQLAETQ